MGAGLEGYVWAVGWGLVAVRDWSWVSLSLGGELGGKLDLFGLGDLVLTADC